MPIKPIETTNFEFIGDLPDREVEAPDSPNFFTETIPAAWRTENVIGSYFADERDITQPSLTTENGRTKFELNFDPNFNPLSEDYLSGYEPFARRFQTVLTQQEGDALKRQIDRELADKETIANSGALGFVAALGAGIVDPTVLVPIGGQATKGRSLYQVSKSMLYAGFVGTTIQEGLLFSQQETRTDEEVAINIAAGTVLAGALGTGGVAAYRKLTGKPINADAPTSIDSDAAQSQRDSVIPEDEEIDWLDPRQTLTIDRLLSKLDDETNETIRTEVNKARVAEGIEPLPEFRVKDDFLELAEQGVDPDASPELPKGVFADLVETDRPNVDRALTDREVTDSLAVSLLSKRDLTFEEVDEIRSFTDGLNETELADVLERSGVRFVNTKKDTLDRALRRAINLKTDAAPGRRAEAEQAAQTRDERLAALDEIERQIPEDLSALTKQQLNNKFEEIFGFKPTGRLVKADLIALFDSELSAQRFDVRKAYDSAIADTGVGIGGLERIPERGQKPKKKKYLGRKSFRMGDRAERVADIEPEVRDTDPEDVMFAKLRNASIATVDPNSYRYDRFENLPQYGLTDAEAKAVELARNNFPNNEIADELGITEATVAVYLTRAREKLQPFEIEVPKGYAKTGTKTERMIQLLARGLDNKAIAERLDMTPASVKNIKSRLKRQGLIPKDGRFALAQPAEQYELAFNGAPALSDAAARQRLNEIRRAAFDAYGGTYRNLEQAGRIKYARQVSDMMPEYRDDDGLAQAYTAEDGTITIFTRTTHPEQIRGIILHEAGIHSGMREMIGAKSMERLLKRLDKLLEEGDAATVRARDNVPPETKPEHVREETLAYLVQHAPRSGIVQEIIAKIRAWIVKTFPGLIEDMKLNEADFRQLALMSLRSEGVKAGRIRLRNGPIWNIHELGREPGPAKPMFNLSNKVADDKLDVTDRYRTQLLYEDAEDHVALVRDNRQAFLSPAFMERAFDEIPGFDPFVWRDTIDEIATTGKRVAEFRGVMEQLGEIKPNDIPKIQSMQVADIGSPERVIDPRFAKTRKPTELPDRPELNDLPSFKELAGTVNAQGRRKASSRSLEFRGVNSLMKFLGRFDPTARVQTSGIKSAQQLNESLVEMSLALNKNAPELRVKKHADGSKERLYHWNPTDQSVESGIIRRTQEIHGRLRRTLANEYAEYLGNRANLAGRLQSSTQSAIGGVQKLTGTTPGKMTMADFGEEVTKSLRRGEKHMDPNVEKAAQRVRNEILQPFEDEMVELGLFGFDMTADDAGNLIATPRRPNLEGTAESYVPRLYDINKIKDNREEFTRMVFEHFKKKRDESEHLALHNDAQLQQMRADRDALNKVIRTTLAKRRGLLKQASSTREGAEGDVRTAKATEKEAKAQNKLAEGRTETLEIDPATEAYYKALYREVMRGRADDEPQDLLAFIRANGGITGISELIDVEIAFPMNIMGNARSKNKPMHWDYMREAAAEAGYIDPEVDGQAFGDILTEAAGGRKIYTDADQDWVAHNNFIEEMAERITVDERGASFTDFVRYMEGKGKVDDRKLSGRATEARLRHRQTAKRLAKGEDLVEDALGDLEGARIAAAALREAAPELTQSINDMRKAAKRLRREINWKKREMDRHGFKRDTPDEFLMDDARETVDNILMTPGGRMQREGRSRSGGHVRTDAHLLSSRFKNRKLDWRDEDIEDWLSSDFDYVLGSFVRSVVPDVEFVKKFGSLDLDTQITRIRREVAEKVESKKITQQKGDEIIRLMIGQRDRLRGVYALPDNPDGAWESAAAVATTANTMRLMGGVTISSIPDVPRAVFANGMRNALGPVVRGMTDNFRGLRLAQQELEDAGVGFEVVLNSRLTQLTDMMSNYGRNSKLERVLQSGQSAFGHASFMTQWNGIWKAVAGQSVQNRLLKMATRKRMSRADAQFAARLGLSPDDIKSIGESFGKHGDTVNGMRFANSRMWRESLREKWQNALRQEVDRVIVTPGADKPLAASTTLGRVVLQFQSYNFAATQRVVGAYAQGLITEPEARILMTFMTQIGLGMMVAGLKASSYGIDVNDWSTEKWVIEGVDRSGVLGVIGSMNMYMESFTGGEIGLGRLAGDQPLSRRTNINRIGGVLGPTFGFFGDLATAGNIVTSGGQADEAQAAALRRLLPLQNVFYLRELFDLLEQSVDESLPDPED